MTQTSVTAPVRKWQLLSGSSLKMIAMITMLIDHIGALLLYASPYYQTFRNIGRISFPLFCFLLVQGFKHTRHMKRYFLSLAVFAIISEIPFDLAFSQTMFDWEYQNIFFTLLIGLAVIWAMNRYCRIPVLQFVFPAAGMVLAYLLKTDYSYIGVLLISVLYFFSNARIVQAFTGAICMLQTPYALYAFIPALMYNGKRGWITGRFKYLFYLFYPVHLLVLIAIRFFLFPNGQ
ncbi:MAG: TraX family protein [Lachnospiraceae bacterium]